MGTTKKQIKYEEKTMCQTSIICPNNAVQNPDYSSVNKNDCMYKTLFIVGIVALIIALCAHIPSMVTGTAMSYNLKVFVYGMYLAGGFAIVTTIALKAIIDTGMLRGTVNYFRKIFWADPQNI